MWAEQLQRFFAANDVAVRFMHGQVFFVLGLAMGLQWRQRSRLELARGLPWVSAFGLCEALAIWGDLFVPLQAAYLDPAAVGALRSLQLFLRLVSMAALLGFGLQLIEPLVPRAMSAGIPIAVTVLGAAGLVLQRLASPVPDLGSAEALLRYAVGAPASLLVAFGLRRQAFKLVGPLGAGRFISALRVTGFGFAFFAVSDGFLAPSSPVLWGPILNESLSFSVLGVPLAAVRAAIGAIIAVFFFVSLDVFRLESDRVAQALGQQQALSAERERISRELHDGTIQSVFAFGLVLDDAQHALRQARAAPEESRVGGPDQPLLDHAEKQIAYAVKGLNQTIADIRGFIYDLRTARADEDLARGLVEIIGEFRMRTGLTVDWRVNGRPTETLTPARRHHVYQVAREALSNVARHAGADSVVVTLDYAGEIGRGPAMRLAISDNGIGVTSTGGQIGRGLRNMRERARLLGGDLSVEGGSGKGTTVMLELNEGQGLSRTS